MKVNTKELKEVLDKMNKHNLRNGIDSNNYFKFENDGNNLVITLCDGVSTIIKGSIEVLEKSNNDLKLFFLPRNTLIKALKLYDSTTSFLLKDNQFTASDGKKNLKIKEYDLNNYIEFSINDFNCKADVEEDFTRQLLKHITYASKKETRPVLTGVCLKHNEIVTTDSYKLCHTQLENIDFEREMIIPCHIIKLIKNIKENIKTIRYSKNENEKIICIELEKIHIYTKLIEGTYPNTSRLIPTDYMYSTTLNKKEIQNNVNALIDLSNKETNAKMYFDKNIMEILINDNLDSFSVLFENKNTYNFKIGFNLGYMKDALNHMENDDLKFLFNGELKPIVIKDSSSTLSLIMPARIYD